MDELSTNAPEPAEIMLTNEPVKRKRESGYARMKRRALIAEAQKRESQDFSKDVAALEALVGRLLDHLDAATSSDITDQDRSRFRRMVQEIRSNLAAGNSGFAPAVARSPSSRRK